LCNLVIFISSLCFGNNYLFYLVFAFRNNAFQESSN